MKSIKSIKCNSDYDLVIKWRMTNQCNAHCSYCIHGRNITKVEDIERDQNKALETVIHINDLINRHPEKKTIKLELIGGEVSMFDLKTIISEIDRLDCINITTNLLRDVDYYLDLIKYCCCRNTKLTMTASFHYEMQPIDVYFDKMTKILDSTRTICAEMPSLTENQSLVKQFIKRCEKLDLDYMVDKDFRSLNDKSHLLSGAKKKNRNPKYTVTFTDGSKQIYVARNQLMTDSSIKENNGQKFLYVSGFYCTHDFNFVYIDIDTVIGWSEYNMYNCKVHTHIKDYDLIKQPRRCPLNKKSLGCTLCGTFDVWKE